MKSVQITGGKLASMVKTALGGGWGGCFFFNEWCAREGSVCITSGQL